MRRLSIVACFEKTSGSELSLTSGELLIPRYKRVNVPFSLNLAYESFKLPEISSSFDFMTFLTLSGPSVY